ncbi:MAG: PD-(D/E)XK nuclease family protein, partial [Planctomycetota bacterium]
GGGSAVPSASASFHASQNRSIAVWAAEPSVWAAPVCPRCFYVNNVLKLSQQTGAAQTLGSAAHTAIERFCEAWKEADAEGTALPPPERLLELGDEAFEELTPANEPLNRAEQARLRAQLEMYLEHLHDLDRGDVQVLETEKAWQVGYEHQGATHTIYARIDRIDQVAGRIRIVDYKTGSTAKRLTEPETDTSSLLQLGIYQMVVDDLFGGPQEGTAEYWILGEGDVGSVELAGLREQGKKALGTKVRDKIGVAIDGILAGDFSGQGPKCYGDCARFWPD